MIDINDRIKWMQGIAAEGTYCASCFLEANKISHSTQDEKNIASLIRKSLADSAILCWTKIFGGDLVESTHWKTLYSDNPRNIKDESSIILDNIPSEFLYTTAASFRNFVYQKDNLQRSEGGSEYYENETKLWESIKEYRDKYLAHCDITNIKDNNINYPNIWPVYKTLRSFSDVLFEIDKMGDLGLFPEVSGRKYSTRHDCLRNELTRSTQKILKVGFSEN